MKEYFFCAANIGKNIRFQNYAVGDWPLTCDGLAFDLRHSSFRGSQVSYNQCVRVIDGYSKHTRQLL